MIKLTSISTELRNENSFNIDTASTLEMVKIINNEDKTVPLAIEKVLPQIASAVDVIYEKLKNGGRLVYLGAGTSGRLGVLDAVECPPTYGVPDNLVIPVLAGGEKAFVVSAEGAEDVFELGIEDLKAINFSEKDVLVGIAASGRTPYVLGGFDYARTLGASTIGLTSNVNTVFKDIVDICIIVDTGAEVITGSTRMKSGTAQKLVLNMLSTCAMIKLGKVYGNLMVDVKCSNDKLVERAKKIVCDATGVDRDTASKYLELSNSSAKHAILMILLNIDYATAVEKLAANNDKISDVLIREKK